MISAIFQTPSHLTQSRRRNGKHVLYLSLIQIAFLRVLSFLPWKKIYNKINKMGNIVFILISSNPICTNQWFSIEIIFYSKT